MLDRFRRPTDDSKDKYAFFFTFFLGVGGLLLIRILGDFFSASGLTFFDFVAILYSIGVLVCYGAYIMQTRDRSGVSIDRASDNIYYLGLLFTLTSLAYSLIKLTALSTPSTSDIGEMGLQGQRILSLLPDFGLALFSTIAGIFGRILLQQMRSDPLDTETEAREELGRAVRELRETIGQIVSQLNGLSAQTNLSLSELSRDVSTTLSESAKKSTEVIDGVSDGIGDLSGKLEARVSEVIRHSQKTSDQYAEVLDGIKKQFEEFSKVPESISMAFEKVSEQLGNVAIRIGETAEQQRQLAAAMTHSTETINSVFSAEEWQNISARLQETQRRFETMGEDIKGYSDGLAGAQTFFNEKMDVLTEAGEALQKNSDSVEAASASVREASQTYIETLSDSALKLRDKTDAQN